MTRLAAVTLDFWGTLVDDRQSAAPLRAAALQRWLPHCSIEQILGAYQASWHRFLQAGALGWGLPPATMLSDTLAALGASLPPYGYQQVLQHWETLALTQPPRLVPGVAEILRTLRAQGLQVALISDTGVTPGRVMRQFLAMVGLRPLFDWLTFSDETGVTKCHPQAFLLTLRALGVEPRRALHVGDTPLTDVNGAHAVGMAAALTVEVRDKRQGGETPELVLERLADLPDALARWSR